MKISHNVDFCLWRTGLPVNRVEIRQINFLNDTAELKLYFDEPKAQHRTIQYELGQADD